MAMIVKESEHSRKQVIEYWKSENHKFSPETIDKHLLTSYGDCRVAVVR